MEVELKLEISQESAIILESSGILPSTSTSIVQRSIYFDTLDRLLGKAGLSLRIRESGGKRIQTVKGDGTGAAGLFVRSEWERAIKSAKPVVDDKTPIKALLGGRVGEIVPMFEVQVERRTWNVQQGSSIIEFVLDRGAVIAGDRQSPVCEIELELKQGEPTDLFAFARMIDALVPARLGVLSKAERGARLRASALSSVKAETITLDAETRVAQAFQKIAGYCIRQFRLNEELLGARNPQALHQARVGLRRLRSAISIFKTILGDEKLVPMREELRWLAGELGLARNLDVLIGRSSVGRLDCRLNDARSAAYAKVEAVLASARARALLLDLSEWVAQGSWLTCPHTKAFREQFAREFSHQQLDRIRKKVRMDGCALADLDDEGRHQVRKDAKKLRYCSEFFASLFVGKRQLRRHVRFIAALEKLQSDLGALNDLVTGSAVLDALGLSEAPEMKSLLAAEDKNALIEAAAEARHDLLDAKRFWT